MADHFTDHASGNAATQGHLHGVAKNDQRCSSLSATSAGILPLDLELQWCFEREKLHLTGRVSHMNTHIDVEEHLEMDSLVQTIETDTDILAQRGFSTEEIAALLWLRQWYQTGGSDRVQIVRHLEFLKLLVLHGKMEL